MGRGGVRYWFAAAAIAAALLCGATAEAHPLGNFTINHLVVVGASGRSLVLHYVLDMAEIPSFSAMHERGIGPGRSRALDAWGAAQLTAIASSLDVEAAGERLPLSGVLRSVTTRPGAGGLATIYLVADLTARLPSQLHSNLFTITDNTWPGRIGWRDIVVRAADDPTHLLTAYPNALLGSPRDTRSLRIEAAADGSLTSIAANVAPAPVAAASTASQTRSNALADLLARGTTSPLLVLFTLMVALGLGALHALEPGHGKTLLAVSLVGARATPLQALVLASALTVAHTAGVIALGLALLAAAQWVVPEAIYPWLTLASGVVVVVLGANALSRFVKARRGAAHAHGHSRGDAHEHDHDHGHGYGHGHHHHEAAPGDRPLSFRSVVLIAMSGNIAPCPAALVVLLAAVTLHQIGYGLVVVLAFSVGLAGVLTGLGVALVAGAAWIAKYPAFDRFVAWGPLVSACVIALLGAIMVGQGLADNPVLRAPAVLITVLTLGAIAGYALRPGHSHMHPHSHARAPGHVEEVSA